MNRPAHPNSLANLRVGGKRFQPKRPGGVITAVRECLQERRCTHKELMTITGYAKSSIESALLHLRREDRSWTDSRLVKLAHGRPFVRDASRPLKGEQRVVVVKPAGTWERQHQGLRAPHPFEGLAS